MDKEFKILCAVAGIGLSGPALCHFLCRRVKRNYLEEISARRGGLRLAMFSMAKQGMTSGIFLYAQIRGLSRTLGY